MKEWWLISTAVFAALFTFSFAQDGKSAFAINDKALYNKVKGMYICTGKL